MKKVYVYTGIFIVLIIFLFIIESSIPNPIDWTPTFNETHKKPWGTLVIHSELNSLFPGAKVEDVSQTPFEKLNFSSDYKNTTYVLIDESQNIDNESVDELLKFVNNGNKVFVSGTNFSYYLLDTLNLDIKTIDIRFPYSDSVNSKLCFYNTVLKSKYDFALGFNYYGFDAWDTITSAALGYQIVDTSNYANFVRVNYGKGSFYFHAQPFAFTNYHMLKQNHADYVAEVFSYINNNTIIWACKNKGGFAGSSPLRFIMSDRALSFAWRLGVIGLLLFVIFNAKRRQRIIPVIDPLPNTSEEFARTIGHLYLREGDAKDIVVKKITFFLEKIRTTYMIDTAILDEDFRKRLEQKSGVDKMIIDKLIDLIKHLNQKNEIGQEQLIELNNLINKFNSKSL